VELIVKQKGEQHRRPNSSLTHTTPYRLSVVAGEKMNQFADFENHKAQISERKPEIETRNSQIANRKSPDDPMSRWPDERIAQTL
jgi:hypothetical protein